MNNKFIPDHLLVRDDLFLACNKTIRLYQLILKSNGIMNCALFEGIGKVVLVEDCVAG